MQELITSIHLYSAYTSGTIPHAELLSLALAADIDVVITTDKNLLVYGVDDYAQEDGRTCLLLTAEEVFDRGLRPSRNHMLVLDANRELAAFAANPQQVAKLATEGSGMAFLAHPCAATETTLGKVLPPWSVEDIPDGFTGLEVWNSLSELQKRASNRLLARLFAWLPRLGRRGPNRAACQYWDQLLATGETITAIAGSGLGGLQRTCPRLQHYLLQNITNHLVVPRPLSGSLEDDRKMVYDALRQGHAFIACDDLAPARGFRFNAKGREEKASIGDSVVLKDSVTFQIRLPQAAKCQLYQDGEVIRTWHSKDICVHNTNQPGTYRVEAYLPYLGQEVAWIMSNPIYVLPYVPPPLSDQLYDS